MISELHEIDNYTLIISPEKTMTIIKTFRNNEHPIKSSAIIKDSAYIMKALSESLSDDLYKTTVFIEHRLKDNIEIENPIKIHVGLKIPKDNKYFSLMDALKSSYISGESIEIEKDIIDKVEITKDGRSLLLPNYKPHRITITPEKVKLPPLRFETYNDNNIRLISLEPIVFLRDKVEGNIAYLSTENKNPLQMKMICDFIKKTAKINFRLKYEDFNVKDVYNAQKFISSLCGKCRKKSNFLQS